jgi:uncharacterized protein
MILADVNVLIYAFRSDSPHHATSRRWLDRVVHDDAAFGISRLALSAVVRITTNRRAFLEPESPATAFAYCNWLLARPNCVTIEPGARHWGIFERVCRETATSGPTITDAWFAALAIEHGCEWITLDRDFAKFRGLKWAVPG